RRKAGEAWQIHAGRRTLPRFAVKVQMAARLFQETIDLAEAKARPLSRRLGRKKGLVCPVQHLLGHSGAGIGRRNDDVLPADDLGMTATVGLIEKDVGGLQGQLAAL